VKSTKVYSWVILIVLALIWGSSFILIKKGLEVYSAGEVGAMRIVAAAIFLLPVAISHLPKIDRKYIKLLFGVGLLGTFIPAFLFAIGQTRLDSGVTGVLNGLVPIFVLIVGATFFKQKFEKSKYLGVLLAFVGTSILVTSGAEGFGSFNYYVIFIVVATACYGTNLNLIKYYLGDLKALVITAISVALVGPIAAVYLFAGTPFIDTLTNEPGALRALGYVALLGVMSTSVALVLFNKLVQITTPIFSSMVTYLIPIVAITWGLIDGEKLMLGQILGILAILLGIIITNRKKKPATN